MKAITYQLRLLEPVLVSQAQTGEENSAIGLPFVPGSALRGAVVSRYLAHNDPGDLAEDEETRALFLDGTVAFLNAYPSVRGQRFLPRPQSWFTEKDQVMLDFGTCYDFAVVEDNPLSQAKQVRAEFCYFDVPFESLDEDEEMFELPPPPDVSLFSPGRQVNVHIALVDQNTRTDQNKVYRYDALTAGEMLAGAIVAPDDFDLELLRTLLAENPDFFLGGAHTAGYGHVRVTSPTVVEHWTEYTSVDRVDDEVVIVTLLSDAILRGPDGQFRADMDGALARLLETPELEAKRTYQRVELVGGFNRKWGLPLVQTWALQAGSVFVYDAAHVDAARLRSLVATGIGERRAEGFGRIAVNWHGYEQQSWRRTTRKMLLAPTLTEESQALAQRMACNHLANVLEQDLTAALSGIHIVHPPQNAQLSRVRNAARQALLKRDVKPLVDHLEALKGAKAQFEKARVAGVPMSDWLKERLQKQDVEQQILKGKSLVPVAGQRATFTPELRVKYTARLIDGVMQKAIRQNQEAGV